MVDMHKSIRDIMNIYNSITDTDLQFNNGFSKFTIMYGRDSVMDIQNDMLEK